MSLLAQVNQPNANRYYFALDSTPADPTVTAPAFEAIGTAPAPVGTFSAQGDGVPGGIDMFNMKTSLGRLQWSIGMNGAAAGANSGNDLAIFGYDDNGAFLNGPLQIQRSTGNVIITEPLATVEIAAGGNVAVAGNISATGDISSNTAGIASALTVGTAATVGGGALEVNGTLGIAQVYDSIYNRPAAGTETLISTYGPTGVPGPLTVFTAPNTGLYTLTMEVKADANGGFAWTNGVNNILGYLQNPFPPFDLLSDAFLACDSVANPTGMVLPVPGGAVQNDAYVKDMVAVVNLVGGTTYSAQANFNPAAFNLGTTGGVRFFIQPLLA